MTDRAVLSTSGKAVDESSISKFAAKLGGSLIRPGDSEYESARRVWNRMIDRRPSLIARCVSPADVVAAVNFARDNEVTAAVRSGGHNVAGKSVADGAMLIDVSALKGVVVDTSKRTVRAGAGLTLGEFDTATQAHGLATTLGTAPPTGIAGLTLGGGMGWLMGKYGLACDNLTGAEIVTAEGKIVRASERENPDLLWGLRGGGGNFGIATMLEYRLHPVTQVLGGVVKYPVSSARDVMRRYREIIASAPDELRTATGVIAMPGERAFSIVVSYCGDLAEGERISKPLRTIARPLVDTIKPISYLEMQALLDVPPIDIYAYGKAGFLSDLGDNAIETIAGKIDAAPNETCFVILELFHGAAARVGATDTAFSHRVVSSNFYPMTLCERHQDSAPGIRWVRDYFDSMRPFMPGGVYVNELSVDDGEERVRAAYGPNYDRLAALKEKYDPANFFRLNQNITPAR